MGTWGSLHNCGNIFYPFAQNHVMTASILPSVVSVLLLKKYCQYVNKQNINIGVLGFKQRNKRLSYPPSLQNSSTDKKTKSNAKPTKTRNICNMYEEGNERGHRVAHYLEEGCCIPDSYAENKLALAEKARSSVSSRKEKSGCIRKE